MQQRTCITCEKLYEPKHGRQKYCGPGCRVNDDHPIQAVTCAGCGTSFLKERRQHRWATHYCSYLCRDYDKHGPRTCALPMSHAARPRKPKPTAASTPRPKFTAHNCMDCGSPFVTADNQKHRYCSDRCSKRVARRKRRARENNAPGNFRFIEVMRMYVAQGKVCAYCEEPCDGLPDPDPEHVLALSRGGRNDATNLVAACRRCNTDKGDLTLTEWAQSRTRRGLPAVNTDTTSAAFAHIVHYEPTSPSWADLCTNPPGAKVPPEGTLSSLRV